MAIQHGINPYTGKIGDRIGRHLKDKFITQKAGGFTKEKWKNERETKLKRAAETTTEFGKCSKMADAIYHGFDINEFRANVAGEVYGILVSRFLDYLKYDRKNPNGKRRPNETAMQQLVGFHFNPAAKNTIHENIEISEPDKATLKLAFNKGANQLL